MITYWLIAVNVILYVIPVLFGLYDDLIANFSVWGPAIREGQTYRLLTGIFLHGGIMHLLFNCYALYVIGSQVENFLGRFKFLVIYLVAGISGALFSMIFGNYASVGASGAIFGLMGALVYFGYHYRVYLGNVFPTRRRKRCCENFKTVFSRVFCSGKKPHFKTFRAARPAFGLAFQSLYKVNPSFVSAVCFYAFQPERLGVP